MKSMYTILAVLLACGINLNAQAAVTASVSKNNFAAGERIQLQLQRDGSTDTQPDIGPLKKDFEVLGSSSGSSVQIINGHVSSKAQITILLAPRHDGKLQVPPLQWGGEQTAAIELTVGGSGGSTRQGVQPANDAGHVYLTATLDQKQPFVQAAVVLTVRLYADQSLYQAALDFPASSDVLVRQLGKDAQSNETRNGRTYQVIERKYLLFPQRSGKLSLKGPVLDAQVADSSANDMFFGNFYKQMQIPGMMNATRPLRVNAKTIELNVLPRPNAAKGANWLPAQKVTLEETWKPASMTMHVGEPLTRHLHLVALGLTGGQLPELGTLMNLPEGLKAYPDQSTVADNTQGNSVLGSRDQDIALMATRPGHYELSAMVVHWWDTVTNTSREVALPARTFDVLPAAAGTNTAALSLNLDANAGTLQQGNPLDQGKAGIRIGDMGESRMWQWLSLAFGLLWLATSMAWWRARQVVQRKPKKNAAEKEAKSVQAGSAIKNLKRACGNNDAHAAREHLLVWAANIWPSDPPRGLNELSRRISGDELAQLIRQLDKACYTGSAWHGEALMKLMVRLPAAEVRIANKQALPVLYPE